MVVAAGAAARAAPPSSILVASRRGECMECSGPRRLGPVAILVASLLAGAGCAPRDDRPSFLVIVADDLRFDALGVVQREQGPQARFPRLETPNLDRLAGEGVRFRNAFVVSSLCSPSRAAFLTGRYGHEVGVIDHETPLDPSVPTFATLLRSAGYATAYVGKWHMGHQVERPGFDWTASYEYQGQYFGASFRVNGSEQEPAGWVDDVTTDYAIGFLRQERREPFLLVVGYKAPHGPRRPEFLPERAYARDAGRAPPPGGGAPTPGASAPPGRLPPGTGRRLYADFVAAMDDALGRLLAELDARGLAERTL